MMKILVGFDPMEYSEVDQFQRLGGCTFLRYDRDFLSRNMGDFDILVPHQFERIDENLVEIAAALKIVATPSTGTDHLDLDALAKAGIKVITLNDDRNFIDEISSTAEMAWLLILACARRLPRLMSRVREERRWVNTDLRGIELAGKTIGVVGYGRLGKMVGEYARAFGMTVLVNDIDPAAYAGDKTVEAVSFEDLCARAAVISLHVKLNETSRNMIDAAAISCMAPGVIIINTARGGLVDSLAILRGLQTGVVAGVGLDVLNDEFQSSRLPRDPLIEASLTDPRIVITPHAGGATLDAHAKVFGKVADLIERHLNQKNSP